MSSFFACLTNSNSKRMTEKCLARAPRPGTGYRATHGSIHARHIFCLLFLYYCTTANDSRNKKTPLAQITYYNNYNVSSRTNSIAFWCVAWRRCVKETGRNLKKTGFDMERAGYILRSGKRSGEITGIGHLTKCEKIALPNLDFFSHVKRRTFIHRISGK